MHIFISRSLFCDCEWFNYDKAIIYAAGATIIVLSVACIKNEQFAVSVKCVVSFNVDTHKRDNHFPLK
jgi:hypothetical protein